MTWPWPAGIGRDPTAARTRAGLDAARRQDTDPDYIGVHNFLTSSAILAGPENNRLQNDAIPDTVPAPGQPYDAKNTRQSPGCSCHNGVKEGKTMKQAMKSG